MIRQVNVRVLADILLLVDLLERATVVLEEQPRRVDAIPVRDAAGILLHHLIVAPPNDSKN
jgi:hypothetical protein